MTLIYSTSEKAAHWLKMGKKMFSRNVTKITGYLCGEREKKKETWPFYHTKVNRELNTEINVRPTTIKYWEENTKNIPLWHWISKSFLHRKL